MKSELETSLGYGPRSAFDSGTALSLWASAFSDVARSTITPPRVSLQDVERGRRPVSDCLHISSSLVLFHDFVGRIRV